MNRYVKMTLVGVTGFLLPFISGAQSSGGTADSLKSMQAVLDQLYNEMIPLCSELIGVGRGIAGFAAT